MIKKTTAKKTTARKVTATAAPHYLLRPVHIEHKELKTDRETFQTRLAWVIGKTGLSMRSFAEAVTAARANGETTKLTFSDLCNYLYHGVTAKANKVGLICLATGLPREFFENFSETKTAILRRSKVKKLKIGK